MDDLESVIEQLKQELGEDKITTASDPKIKRPEKALERDMYKDFMDRNPLAGGGMLVQPGFGGTRQGYAEELPANVQKNKQGNYFYRSGKGDNVIYKSGFKTPEAASKWGQKEFVKKFALPNKFVNPSELTKLIEVGAGEGSGMRSPFFERKDRPNYLLQEARRILGSYEAGGNTYFKAPTKKQIEYLKKYSKAPRITEGLAKNVQIILDSKAIMNDLTGKNKGGAKLPEFNKVVQVFKNAGVNASDAQITNALQKAAYLLRGDTFQTDVKYDVDKNTGRFVIKELEKLPFDNQYARGIYKHALNEIRLELGETAGNLDSFKRNLRKRLPDGFLQKHGLEINEIFSVRASAKNKAFPYAYFLDATDAELNKKALRSFHGALSRAQTDLNNKIADIRAGKAKYDEAVDIIKKFQKTRSKFKNTIETNYPGKNFNLADIVLGKESEVLKKNMKIPEDVYSKKLLDKWKNQGLDITGHAKKTGYVMTGADSPSVFTAQDLSRDKTSRNLFVKQINNDLLNLAATVTDKCAVNLKADGGRIGYSLGSEDCLKIGKKALDSGLTKGFKNKQQVDLAGAILRAGGGLKSAFALRGILGPAAIAATVAFEGGLIGYDMLSSGKTLREAFGDNLLNYALGKDYQIDPQEELFKRFKGLGYNDQQLGKIKTSLDAMNTINTGTELAESFGTQAEALQKSRGQPQPFMGPEDQFIADTSAQRAEQNLKDTRNELSAFNRDLVRSGELDRLNKLFKSGDYGLGLELYDEAQRRATVERMQSGGPKFMGSVFPKFEERRIRTISENLPFGGANPAFDFPGTKEVTGGTLYGFAGGGIAGLSGGIDKGPQIRSMNSDSQGLSGLLKRGIKG
jgi:hypothetical protein